MWQVEGWAIFGLVCLGVLLLFALEVLANEVWYQISF